MICNQQDRLDAAIVPSIKLQPKQPLRPMLRWSMKRPRGRQGGVIEPGVPLKRQDCPKYQLPRSERQSNKKRCRSAKRTKNVSNSVASSPKCLSSKKVPNRRKGLPQQVAVDPQLRPSQQPRCEDARNSTSSSSRLNSSPSLFSCKVVASSSAQRKPKSCSKSNRTPSHKCANLARVILFSEPTAGKAKVAPISITESTEPKKRKMETSVSRGWRHSHQY